MSIGFKYIKEKSLVISVWDGKVTLEEWLENLRRLLADPDFPTTWMQLVDLRFTSIDPSIDEAGIRQGAELIGSYPVKTTVRKVAVVAGKEFDRPKMFERMIKQHSWNVIVFNDILTACTWLGIDPIETEQEIQQIRLSLRNEQKNVQPGK